MAQLEIVEIHSVLFTIYYIEAYFTCTSTLSEWNKESMVKPRIVLVHHVRCMRINRLHGMTHSLICSEFHHKMIGATVYRHSLHSFVHIQLQNDKQMAQSATNFLWGFPKQICERLLSIGKTCISQLIDSPVGKLSGIFVWHKSLRQLVEPL